MNIRAVVMGRAMETLAQQSRIIPPTIFRGHASVNCRTGEEPSCRVVIEELEQVPHHDIDEDV
jgi:hypothetical protein